jgi:hypothetical protein
MLKNSWVDSFWLLLKLRINFKNEKSMSENQLPQKPDNAIWNAIDNEWELGQKNSQGKYIGEWMWWLAPTNHLCCHTFFDDNGNMLSYTRYHIDGTYSQKGTYKNGVQHGTFYYQDSENETTENCIPPQAPEGTFRMTYEYDNGQFVSAQFFTLEGVEMDRYGNIAGEEVDDEDESEEVITNTEFASVEEASRRWIAEGKTYKDSINDWLDIIYIDEQNPSTECPEETRKDMSSYVINQIGKFNDEKKFDELRQLFPPDNDPMNWENLTSCVTQVAILTDNRIVVTINQWYQERWMYIINENDIQLIEENMFMFGKSYDKKYFAKAYPDKIVVTEGWEGKTINTFYPPKDYGSDFKTKFPNVETALDKMNFADFKIEQIVVFPSGNSIAIASQVGVFVINANDYQYIHAGYDIEISVEEYLENLDSEEDSEKFSFSNSYPHVDVSPDEEYLVAGNQNSQHLIFKKENGIFIEAGTIEPRSSYPNLAKFNAKIADNGEKNEGPQLLLCSCHFGQSASISLPIKNITPNFEASGYEADDVLNYVDDSKWVFAAGNYGWGWALGTNDGYIWFKHFGGYQYGYLHVGGTVMDIDFSEDRKHMLVASYSGQVIKYNCDEIFGDSLFRSKENKQEKRKDTYAITNTAYKDVKRYLFWNGFNPMVW